MHTKERLALAMEEANCHPDMVQAARDGWFDDYESMLPMPKFALAAELRERGHIFLADRVTRGEFANTKEEEQEYYATHDENEGREMFKAAMPADARDPGGRIKRWNNN